MNRLKSDGERNEKIPRLPLKETQRIVVLGAGIAGLSAAQRLAKNGFKNITVLEASNRFVTLILNFN